MLATSLEKLSCRQEKKMAGYSKTPLSKKLGIKPDFLIHLINEPDNYYELVSPLPEKVTVVKGLSSELDMIHLFTKERDELETQIPILMQKIKQAGMIWVSWPKKSSKVPTDVTEDVIREVILPLGLVDVKVCAIDATWSGLKVVIRKENRK